MVSTTHGDFHLECAGDESLNLTQLAFPQVNGNQQQQLTIGAVTLTCPGGRGGEGRGEGGGGRGEVGGGREREEVGGRGRGYNMLLFRQWIYE